MAIRVIFCGSDAIALPCLDVLKNSPFVFCGIYTQPDRPKGRGLKLASGPIKVWAEENNIAVYQPEKITDDVVVQLKALQPDIIIVMAYGIIVPQKFLDVPRLGCVNLHVSLLPKWRGAAPIQRAILAGDVATGITMMQMDAGLDTGDILAQYAIAILPSTTSADLQTKLGEIGANNLVKLISDLDAGLIQPNKQNAAAVTYAKKLSKTEAEINWQLSAITIDRMIRAFNPWPVAFTKFNNLSIRIWQAEIITTKSSAQPGAIISLQKNGIDVATGDGVIRITKLQFPGKKQTSVAELLNGRVPFAAHDVLQ
jgi:methionyl-tRNA formyltransferase